MSGTSLSPDPAHTVRLLFLMYDPLPPFRPDVAALFGRELPLLGVRADLLGQEDKGSAARSSHWPAGSMWLTGRLRGGPLGEFLRPLADLWGLRRLSPEHKVIQVRDKIRTGLLALLVARLTGRQFTYWMSFPFAEGFEVRARQLGARRGRLVQFANWVRAKTAGPVFYGFVAPHADHLFVQSEAMLDFMADKGIPRERMTAVPMGVDLELFNPSVARNATPARLQGRLVVAYLGVLARARQSDFLLQAFRQIKAQRPQAMLLLIGDASSNDEHAWIRETISSSGLADDIWLTGWMPQREAVALLRHAHVGLSPVPRGTLYDVSSPTKAVEYLALGIPCVGNDIPDQKLVLECSGGGVCVPMDAESFARAAVEILDDSALAARLGACGSRWVRANRSYSVIARSVAAAYSGLLRAK